MRQQLRHQGRQLAGHITPQRKLLIDIRAGHHSFENRE
jgi:hypothetical protein